MLSRWIRTWDSRVLRPFLLLLARLGITPNAITLASLLLVIASGVLLAAGRQVAGAAVLLLGGLLDGIDGELARVLDRETPFGGFLDSIVDHYGDLAVFLGLLWWYLGQSARAEIVLLVLALFGSMLGSQVRSRAGMLGIDLKTVGWLTRAERILILVAGLLVRQTPVALGALAVLNNFSALQRLAAIVRQAHRAPREHAGSTPR